MKKVYEELGNVVDIDAMMKDGKYFTYYENLEEYVKYFEEQGWEREEILENLSNIVDLDGLKGSFILLDEAGVEGGYVYTNEDTIDDIIHLMKSEQAFRKYVK